MAANGSLEMNVVSDNSTELTRNEDETSKTEQWKLIRDESSFCQKLAVVEWRKVVIVFVIIVDYFLIYSSISLIGAFFPIKVYTNI